MWMPHQAQAPEETSFITNVPLLTYVSLVWFFFSSQTHCGKWSSTKPCCCCYIAVVVAMDDISPWRNINFIHPFYDELICIHTRQIAEALADTAPTPSANSPNRHGAVPVPQSQKPHKATKTKNKWKDNEEILSRCNRKLVEKNALRRHKSSVSLRQQLV